VIRVTPTHARGVALLYTGCVFADAEEFL
jgi:hypothetical protein